MDFIFTPVIVTRGRKFRGKAYSIGDTRPGMYGSWNSKLWEPVSKKFVWANTDFCNEDESVTPEQVEAAKAAFIDYLIEDAKNWCASVKPGAAESEVCRFARNVVRKRWPFISEEVLAAHGLNDSREACSEVMKTLEWAMGLKTRACWMYGRFCPGGRPIAEEKKMTIARKAIYRKGLNKLNGFEASLTMALTLMGLMKYYDMFVEK